MRSDILADAVIATFSEMAFLDVSRSQEEPALEGTSHVVEISYGGVENGNLVMVLPLDCKRVIVENIFGASWQELDGEAIDDCILELINVVAGEYLKHRFDAGAKRELSLPRLVFDIDEIETKTHVDNLYLDAEGIGFSIVHHYDVE